MSIKAIGASYVVDTSEGFRLHKNSVLLYDSEIQEIVSLGYAKEHFDEIEFHEGAIITPVFTNPHLHLEFSANRGELLLGSFRGWLDSVIEKREELVTRCDATCIKGAIDALLAGGVVNVGAISSFGKDIAPLCEAPLKGYIFHEIIGSNPGALDALYADLQGRVEEAKDARLTSSFAIHSPYSVHPMLAKKVIGEAMAKKLPISAHFLESYDELEWLSESRGFLEQLFAKLGVKNAAPFLKPLEFLELFSGASTLFTHCNYAEAAHLEKIKEIDAKIVSCPRSNRLLGSRYLDVTALAQRGIEHLFATDGLSSNSSLSMLDELRTVLFAYTHQDVESLARELIIRATREGADTLGVNNGSFAKGKSADIALFPLQGAADIGSIASYFLLYCSSVSGLIINGEKVI